jgi:nitrogen-specific signal transduction histidine kinase
MIGYLIVSLVDFGLFSFILAKKRDKLAISCSLLCFVAGLYNLELFFLSYIKNLSLLYPLFQITRVGLFFSAPCLVLFSYMLINQRSVISKFVVIALFINSFIVMVVGFFVIPSELYAVATGYLPQRDIVYAWVSYSFIMGAIISIIMLVSGYSNGKKVERQRFKWVSFAFILFTIFSVVAFKYSKLFGMMGNLVGLSTLLYAVLKYELLNVQVVINRILSYGIIAFFISLIFIMVDSVASGNKYVSILNILICIAVAFIAEPIREKLQTSADQKWITDYYKPATLNKTITEKLAPVLEQSEMFNVINQVLTEKMKIRESQWFIAVKDPINEDEVRHYKKHIVCGRDFGGGSLGVGCAVVKVFDGSRVPVLLGRLKSLKADLVEAGLPVKGVCLPIHGDVELVGFIVLGEKVSEGPYTKDDLEVLDGVVSQSRLILARIFPHEKIKFEHMKSMEVAEQATADRNFADLTKQIAHDIMNPMASVTLAVETMMRILEGADFELKPKVDKFVKTVYKCSSRAIEVSDSIMQYTYRGEDEKGAVDINGVVADMNNLTMKAINVSLDLAEDLPLVYGDKVHLNRVFMNIFNNAVQATSESGDIVLRTKKTNYIDSAGNQRDGVEIEISDTGVGMAEQQRRRVFDPLFSTKPDGHGLGLSIVKEIIERHEGVVRVESVLNKGTSFFICLPRCKSSC